MFTLSTAQWSESRRENLAKANLAKRIGRPIWRPILRLKLISSKMKFPNWKQSMLSKFPNWKQSMLSKLMVQSVWESILRLKLISWRLKFLNWKRIMLSKLVRFLISDAWLSRSLNRSPLFPLINLFSIPATAEETAKQRLEIEALKKRNPEAVAALRQHLPYLIKVVLKVHLPPFGSSFKSPPAMASYRSSLSYCIPHPRHPGCRAEALL